MDSDDKIYIKAIEKKRSTIVYEFFILKSFSYVKLIIMLVSILDLHIKLIIWISRWI